MHTGSHTHKHIPHAHTQHQLCSPAGISVAKEAPIRKSTSPHDWSQSHSRCQASDGDQLYGVTAQLAVGSHLSRWALPASTDDPPHTCQDKANQCWLQEPTGDSHLRGTASARPGRLPHNSRRARMTRQPLVTSPAVLSKAQNAVNNHARGLPRASSFSSCPPPHKSSGQHGGPQCCFWNHYPPLGIKDHEKNHHLDSHSPEAGSQGQLLRKGRHST